VPQRHRAGRRHPRRTRLSPRRHVALGLVFLMGPLGQLSGTQGVALVGTVSDSLTGDPVSAVRISALPDLFTVTDSSGTFRLNGMRPGDYQLQIHKVGFAGRRFRLTVDNALSGEVSLGSIALLQLPSQVVSLSGQIRSSRTGDPVVGAPIGINGRPAALSNDTGGFAIRTINAQPGELNRLTVRRIGYKALDYDFWFAEQDSAVQLALELEPFAEKLPEITVEGERVVIGGARMAGFNRRMKFGLGDFLTRQQIDQINPKEVTDLFRRIPGFSVVGDGPARRITPHSGSCPAAVVYVDGVRASTDNLDLLLSPDGVLGVEMFRSTSQLPPEYSIAGAESSGCAVVGIWTR